MMKKIKNFIGFLVVHCPILWTSKDGVAYRTRWSWVDKWLEYLRW